MFGDGCYNGTIRLPPNGNVPAEPANQPYPLARGYATVVSDSGHQAGPQGALNGSFGVNDEAVRNFSRDALKKTRDVAIAPAAPPDLWPGDKMLQIRITLSI